MTKKPIVIFGTGDIAQLARYYFEIDSAYEAVAFTVDRAYAATSEYEGRPLVPFDEVERAYPPGAFGMFIALSYAQMNHLRAEKYHAAKTMGYELVSYISSRCSWLTPHDHGDNCFVLEDNTVQPFSRIGSNVTLWSGNHIGHHSVIHDHNFVSSHVVISGHCEVESYCFLGVNSTIGHAVTIAKETLVGAGASITKSTEPQGVYVPERSRLLDKKSVDVKL